MMFSGETGLFVLQVLCADVIGLVAIFVLQHLYETRKPRHFG